MRRVTRPTAGSAGLGSRVSLGLRPRSATLPPRVPTPPEEPEPVPPESPWPCAHNPVAITNPAATFGRSPDAVPVVAVFRSLRVRATCPHHESSINAC